MSRRSTERACGLDNQRRGGGGHEAMVLVCLPLAAPIGLSPLHILTFRGPERVLVGSTEPPDDLSYLSRWGEWVGGWSSKAPTISTAQPAPQGGHHVPTTS